MNKIIFEYEVLIRESHLDTFGHVNNAVYVALFEEARWDFMNKKGIGLEQIQSAQEGPVILDLSVRFKVELKNRERIRILSEIKSVTNSKIFVLEQTMVNQNEVVASVGTFTMGFIDMKRRKLIEIPQEWLNALGI